MRRDFPLENGIVCKGKTNNFKLYYNDIPLTPSCHMISYVPNTLIVVKSKKTVYIYSPNLTNNSNNISLVNLAMFNSYNSNAYMKIKIKGKVYIIDCNAQISLCECKRIY